MCKTADVSIREMKDNDWEKVREIYKSGIETGFGTFEREVPGWKQWNEGHHKVCRLVAVIKGEVAGFAVLQTVSKRKVYGGVAEVSIYIKENCRHTGVGEKLLNSLIIDSEKHGFWTLQSSIFSDNIPSRKLHAKCGFRTVGTREKQAKDFSGRWRDTILMERRSKTVGID